MATVEIIPPSDHDQSAVTAFEESGDAENDSHFSPSGKGLKTMNVSITGTQANGLGMVIVGGYKEGEEFGIFVKSVRPNGPVARDGHIRVGDQLLSVNGTSLRGVSNDQAVLQLKAGARTDHVHLEIARDAGTRSDFKRLSQVMHFNPGETPPEIRELVRHTVIPTRDSNLPHSTSSSDLGSVSSRMSQSDDEGNFRSSSTPAMLSDEISEALRRKGHPISASLDFLQTGLDFLQTEDYSPSQKQNLSAKEIELSMMASPTKGDWKDSAQNERDQSPHTSQPKAAAPPPPTSPPPELDQEPSLPTEPPPAVPEGDSDRPPSSLSLDNAATPPEPSSAPPPEPSSAPPPEPSSAPPPDDNSDELAPPLPSSLPPTRSESFPTGTERPLREHTFSFPKTLGIGFTIKAAASGPTVCIDRVIRGLDAYKDGNLRSGDILLSVNDESYEGMAVEEAQKQLTLLKTRHQLKEYTVKVAREEQEDEEEVQEEEEVPAVVEPGQRLESSPPPLQLPASESQESVESSPSLHKGSRTSLPREASPPSRTSSKSSIHEKLQIPSERSSRVSSTVSLTMANEGTPDNKQVGKVGQDGLSQATVELPKVHAEKEELVRSKALEEQALGRKSEEQSIFVAATLPASASGEPKRDSTGSKKDRVSIDPSTPLKETPTRARKERDSSSIHARLSLDPNTRVKLSKLEMGLRYMGHSLAHKQQQEMRDRLDIDDEGRVVFVEFIDVAREMFAFNLDEKMFEPGSLFSLALSPKDNIEPPIFSKRGYSMISNSDSSQSSHGGYEPSPEGQQKSIEAKRQQLYKEGALRRTEESPARLVSALSGVDSEESSARQQVAKQQEEITRLKSKLLEKERQCRDLELQVHSSLRDVTASSGDLEALRKRLALSEAACKAGRSKEAQLNENVQRLENKLAATRQQLVEQTPSELRKKLAILDCQLKKEQQSSKRYQVAVEMLLAFGEKAHEALTATLDTGSQPIVFHPRGKGESVRRGDSVTGNPRPPQYLAQHSKKTALTLAQDAQEVVQAARKVISKEDLPFGWEESHTEDGQKYYVNHQTQSTTWAHPPSSSKSGSRASTPSTRRPERVHV